MHACVWEWVAGKLQLKYKKGKKSGDLSDMPVVCPVKLIMESSGLERGRTGNEWCLGKLFP